MESFLSLLNGISPALSTINQHSLGSKICCPHKSSHSKKNCSMNIWMHSFCKNFTAQVFLHFAHPGRETKESDQVFQPLLPPEDGVRWVTLLAGTVVISGDAEHLGADCGKDAPESCTKTFRNQCGLISAGLRSRVSVPGQRLRSGGGGESTKY